MSLVFSAPLRANRPRRNAIFVGTSTNTSSALDGYGRIWVWGSNGFGQVGNNTTLSVKTPVTVAGNPKTFCKIDSGINGMIAIDKYGQVWGWGSGGSGRIGNNSTVSRLTPVSVAGGRKTFCEIKTSLGIHSIGIDKYGQVWAWGDGSNGRLGTNSTVSRLTPVSILGQKKTFCKVDAGNAWTAAIDKYGQVWCWGNGGDGRLGRNSTVSFLTPVSITGQKKTFCHISAGNATTAGIDKYGIIWSWGFNNSGQLGNGANTAVWTPVSLAGARKTFCKIDLGNGQTIAIDQYGQAWGWGFNTVGLIGNGTNFAFNTPVRVCGNITFCEISAGSQQSLAVDKNNRVWGWGPFTSQELGNNAKLIYETPVSVAGVKTFCKITTRNFTGHSIDKYGQIWGWGYNGPFGKIGDNSTINKYSPVSILGSKKTFCEISEGVCHVFAVDRYGQAWGWGGNGNQNSLGMPGVLTVRTPASIQGAKKTFCKISMGFNTSIAIDYLGQIWSWGNNVRGALGLNTSVGNAATPTSIRGNKKTFCDVAISQSNNPCTIGLDKYGQVWTWGLNGNGQLGNNTTIASQMTPVSLGGQKKTFCRITTVYNSAVAAIDQYGQIWGWGSNIGFVLGNSSTVNFFTPVSITGAKKTFCQINSTLAVDKYGKMWGWGLNTNGTLGTNNTIDVSIATPTLIYKDISVCTTLSRILSQASSIFHAIDKDGQGWGWGYVNAGRIGNAKFHFEMTPIKVCTI